MKVYLGGGVCTVLVFFYAVVESVVCLLSVPGPVLESVLYVCWGPCLVGITLKLTTFELGTYNF